MRRCSVGQVGVQRQYTACSAAFLPYQLSLSECITIELAMVKAACFRKLLIIYNFLLQLAFKKHLFSLALLDSIQLQPWHSLYVQASHTARIHSSQPSRMACRHSSSHQLPSSNCCRQSCSRCQRAECRTRGSA